MNRNRLFLLFVYGTIQGSLLSAQERPFVSRTGQLGESSFAEWISMPGIHGTEYGVYHFRKRFTLDNVPEEFLVHVSGDNRYRLFVNGKLMCLGPAAGDHFNWNYETIDLAAHLEEGPNIVAAQVWNAGGYRGARQVSFRTAFILQGKTSVEQVINTGSSWKVSRNTGYFPLPHSDDEVGGGYIAGATDSLDAKLHPWGWEKLSFDDEAWSHAKELGKGNHLGLNTWLGTPWLLNERIIPLMQQAWEKTPVVLQVEGADIHPEELSSDFAFTVPANSKVVLLLDNGRLTMGFPELRLSSGKDAKVKIRYQESLFGPDGRKGNRNEWQGKTMKGYYDVFICDGGRDRSFEPLWIRTFRYISMEIETRDEPLEVHDFRNLFTAYPFRQKGGFNCDLKSIGEIWEVAWRTVRLCALETYMDCPYYEQLQYIGDTRLQALISMYVTGDERLAKNAIRQFYQSIQPMGLTNSNHPSRDVQIIPPFSLLYIHMIHDYFMLGKDPVYVEEFIPGIRLILNWFLSKIGRDGMPGPIPFWNHIDGGTKGFDAGSPPGMETGGSAHMGILLAYTLNRAAEMLDWFGHQQEAEQYRVTAGHLIGTTLDRCFDTEKGLIAETPEKLLFSQHTNAMAILSDAFSPDQAKQVARKMIEDSTLVQATLYFNFYVFQALGKAGLGGEIIGQLGKWETFLDYGLTTFPEHGINSRSDCHAWSSHPMYNLLHIVCGVSSARPGFKSVQVAPQLGPLKFAEGRVTHPYGTIATRYEKNPEGTLECQVTLPDDLTGTLVWKGNIYPLAGGSNLFTLE